MINDPDVPALAGTGPTVPERAGPGATEPDSAGASPTDASPTRGRAAWWEWAAVFVLALGLSMAFYHVAWSNPLRNQVGGAGDADEYAWFLAWLPFALGHAHNPLVSHFVAFPRGVNLMWNTSVLLPSFLVSPLTLIFGAAFSYNVLVTLGTTLNTLFGFVAFRRWAPRVPALAGSLVFGFSPSVLSQSAGHLAQVLVMSAPLFLILLDRLLVVQASKAWLDGLLLGLLAWAQLLTGEEVLAMEAVTAAIAVVVLGVLARRELSRRWPYALKGAVVAAATFLVFSLPFLVFQFLGPYKVQDVHPKNAYVSDFLNFFVPTNIMKFAPTFALNISHRFTGNGSEDGAYIGIPLIIFIALTLWWSRKRRVTWVALAIGAGAGILSMGETVHVLGHVSPLPLPDDALQALPTLHNILPDRFAAIMSLGVGFLVAIGLGELKRLKPLAKAGGWGLAAVGLVALVPITHFPAASSPLYSAFVSGFSCPHPTPQAGRPPVALLIPGVNELNLRWEAESHFCFLMPTDTGMTGTNSAFRQNEGLLFRIGDPAVPGPPPVTATARQEAAAEIRQYDITEIVVDPESPTSPPWSPEGQAQAVVWIEWLLGQAPQQSKDTYISYVWKDLPPVSDIASGHVGTVPGEA